MFSKVKQDLFTVPGILTTLFHVFFLVGFVTCAILFRTEVLGFDPTTVKSVTRTSRK